MKSLRGRVLLLMLGLLTISAIAVACGKAGAVWTRAYELSPATEVESQDSWFYYESREFASLDSLKGRGITENGIEVVPFNSDNTLDMEALESILLKFDENGLSVQLTEPIEKPDLYFVVFDSQSHALDCKFAPELVEDTPLVLSIPLRAGRTDIGISLTHNRQVGFAAINLFSITRTSPGKLPSVTQDDQQTANTPTLLAEPGYDSTDSYIFWKEVNLGDYDNNGEVGVPDITPLALNYFLNIGKLKSQFPDFLSDLFNHANRNDQISPPNQYLPGDGFFDFGGTYTYDSKEVFTDTYLNSVSSTIIYRWPDGSPSNKVKLAFRMKDSEQQSENEKYRLSMPRPNSNYLRELRQTHEANLNNPQFRWWYPNSGVNKRFYVSEFAGSTINDGWIDKEVKFGNTAYTYTPEEQDPKYYFSEKLTLQVPIVISRYYRVYSSQYETEVTESTKGKTYVYQIRTWDYGEADEDGNPLDEGPPSNTVEFTFPQSTAVTLADDTLTATEIGGHSVTLSWNIPDYPDDDPNWEDPDVFLAKFPQRYDVHWRVGTWNDPEDVTALWLKEHKISISNGVATTKLTGLSSTEEYSFVIRSYGYYGEGPAISEVVNIETEESQPDTYPPIWYDLNQDEEVYDYSNDTDPEGDTMILLPEEYYGELPNSNEAGIVGVYSVGRTDAHMLIGYAEEQAENNDNIHEPVLYYVTIGTEDPDGMTYEDWIDEQIGGAVEYEVLDGGAIPGGGIYAIFDQKSQFYEGTKRRRPARIKIDRLQPGIEYYIYVRMSDSDDEPGPNFEKPSEGGNRNYIAVTTLKSAELVSNANFTAGKFYDDMTDEQLYWRYVMGQYSFPEPDMDSPLFPRTNSLGAVYVQNTTKILGWVEFLDLRADQAALPLALNHGLIETERAEDFYFPVYSNGQAAFTWLRVPRTSGPGGFYPDGFRTTVPHPDDPQTFFRTLNDVPQDIVADYIPCIIYCVNDSQIEYEEAVITAQTRGPSSLGSGETRIVWWEDGEWKGPKMVLDKAVEDLSAIGVVNESNYSYNPLVPPTDDLVYYGDYGEIPALLYRDPTEQQYRYIYAPSGWKTMSATSPWSSSVTPVNPIPGAYAGNIDRAAIVSSPGRVEYKSGDFKVVVSNPYTETHPYGSRRLSFFVPLVAFHTIAGGFENVYVVSATSPLGSQWNNFAEAILEAESPYDYGLAELSLGVLHLEKGNDDPDYRYGEFRPTPAYDSCTYEPSCFAGNTGLYSLYSYRESQKTLINGHVAFPPRWENHLAVDWGDPVSGFPFPDIIAMESYWDAEDQMPHTGFSSSWPFCPGGYAKNAFVYFEGSTLFFRSANYTGTTPYPWSNAQTIGPALIRDGVNYHVAFSLTGWIDASDNPYIDFRAVRPRVMYDNQSGDTIMYWMGALVHGEE